MESKSPHQRLLDETDSLPTNGLGQQKVISSIPTGPVTVEKRPFIQSDQDLTVTHTGKPTKRLKPENRS